MRRPLIAGNWKMNGLSADAMALAGALRDRLDGLEGIDRVVCPPHIHLAAVAGELAQSAIAVGAQNCADAPQGARTGEVAADMIADAGARYVILGHSERRQYYGEDEALIAARCGQALAAGLRPILCVGETLEAREADRTEATVAAQIHGVLDRLGAEGLGEGVIAYEPVWAIGTGRTASAEQAQQVHGFIRGLLAERLGGSAADAMRILYGGSMKADNAEALLAQPDVDGGLIGGASLQADSFAAICAAAARG